MDECPNSGFYWRLIIFLICHVRAPCHRTSCLIRLLHCDVGHVARWCSTMPVLFHWLEVSTLTGVQLFDGSTTLLYACNTIEHIDGLSKRMRMPCCSRSGEKTDESGIQARGYGRGADVVDVDGTGKPLFRSKRGIACV